MELVNSETGWSCYKPEKEYNKGHLVFCFSKSDLDGRNKAVDTASKYGRSLVDIGLAKDYYLITMPGSCHISPVYDDDHLYDFYSFLNIHVNDFTIS